MNLWSICKYLCVLDFYGQNLLDGLRIYIGIWLLDDFDINNWELFLWNCLNVVMEVNSTMYANEDIHSNWYDLCYLKVIGLDDKG